MKIAVEGCCHGELDKIYESIAYMEKRDNIKVDLLLCCGDFQAVRNYSDLNAMAVPQKYQKLNTFYKYYSGEKEAPLLTIFIGGNHEASNYLQELPYGGWVAKNIYYLGYAGVIQIGGIRIGGLTGIYKSHDYHKGHFERLPYDNSTKRSVYHIRSLEVFRLKQLSRPVDIFLTHDWPEGIYNFGNKDWLIMKKPFFKEDIARGALGSPPAMELLQHLKPDYWFSAHLHVKFAALVEHKMSDGNKKLTKFLSLDKCLPKRNFLQVIDIPHDSQKPLRLELDAEWLSVLRATDQLLSLSRANTYLPRESFAVSDKQIEDMMADFGHDLTIPLNFEPTAPILLPPAKRPKPVPEPEMYTNAQSALLCEMVGIRDHNSTILGKSHDVGLDISQNTSCDVSQEEDELDTANETYQSFHESSSSFIDDSINRTTNSAEISLDGIGSDYESDAGKSEPNQEEPEQYHSPNHSASLNPASITGGSSASFYSAFMSLSNMGDVSPIMPTAKTSSEKDKDQSPDATCSGDSTESSKNVIIEEKVVSTNASIDTVNISPIKESVESSRDVFSPPAPVRKMQDMARDSEPTDSPKLKKFKRRNASLYSSQEDS